MTTAIRSERDCGVAKLDVAVQASSKQRVVRTDLMRKVCDIFWMYGMAILRQ